MCSCSNRVVAISTLIEQKDSLPRLPSSRAMLRSCAVLGACMVPGSWGWSPCIVDKFCIWAMTLIATSVSSQRPRYTYTCSGLCICILAQGAECMTSNKHVCILCAVSLSGPMLMPSSAANTGAGLRSAICSNLRVALRALQLSIDSNTLYKALQTYSGTCPMAPSPILRLICRSLYGMILHFMFSTASSACSATSLKVLCKARLCPDCEASSAVCKVSPLSCKLSLATVRRLALLGHGDEIFFEGCSGLTPFSSLCSLTSAALRLISSDDNRCVSPDELAGMLRAAAKVSC